VPWPLVEAPIENSPPGIHTIPSGALPEADFLLGTVDPNVAVAAFGSLCAFSEPTLNPKTAIRGAMLCLILAAEMASNNGPSSDGVKTKNQQNLRLFRRDCHRAGSPFCNETVADSE
jgi:hypothetical protein